jgi:1-deoxy-D-xylulose-5-phosphate synthase
MSLLARMHSPADLKSLRKEELPLLAQEVRERLIQTVSVTGGHIGASLGCVELAIALLREFDSPTDKIVWDVGHQAYAWKLLTGRNEPFPTLRTKGGISGFLKRSESPHDQFGAGHAGTAMSAALGMATARDLMGLDYKVVAVVGDGALTCGLSYEGMNNAGHSDRDVILIVNDNGMSISPNVGAMNKLLGAIVADPRTNRMREHVKKLTVKMSHVFGPGVVDFAKNVEESVKNLFSPGMFFEEMGSATSAPSTGTMSRSSPKRWRSSGDSPARAWCTSSRRRGRASPTPKRTRRSGTASRRTIPIPANLARRRAVRPPGPRSSVTRSPRSRRSATISS